MYGFVNSFIKFPYVSFLNIPKYSSYANTLFLAALVVSCKIPSSTSFFTAIAAVL